MRRTFSASVFCRYAGKILLVKHNRLNLWLPVGGELEAGESPLEAAARETREETGFTPRFPRMVDAPAGTPRGFLGFEEHAAGDKGWHMNFCFLADVDSYTPKSDGSWSDFIWVNPYDLQGDKTIETPENVRDVIWNILLARTA